MAERALKVGDYVRTTAYGQQTGFIIEIAQDGNHDPAKPDVKIRFPDSQQFMWVTGSTVVLIEAVESRTQMNNELNSYLASQEGVGVIGNLDLGKMNLGTLDGSKIAKEIRTTSETGGEKGMKPERYDLIPVDALATIARLYGKGAAKYAEHNWRKGYEWSKSYAAMHRHMAAFWNGEDNDPETGEPHMAAVAFHSLTLLTFMQEQPGFDDRFKA